MHFYASLSPLQENQKGDILNKLATNNYVENNGDKMKKLYAILFAGILVLAFLSGYLYNQSLSEAPFREQPQQSNVFQESGKNSATVFVPAIDEKGRGVAMPLIVRSMDGTGETLIDINNLVFWFDTQQSIQTAKNVAQDITGKDLGKASLVYTIGANASIVEGPSAGAALAVATIAALENKPLNMSVMITGTINPDGTIGEVGGILEKASAAKQAGAELFLVPKGQGTETLLKPTETCSKRNSFVYCTTKYTRTTIDISETAGIQVKEVSSVKEAENYFFV